ncbi:MYND-type domain-containing protein [Mycena kentingensis (nom. inval.)]|nr:MYND-type domain-containing protein [Mycena kentingensis (nom. inval.)]
MHPAFDPDRLKRLPPTIQRIIQTACKTECTFPDLYRFQGIWRNSLDNPRIRQSMRSLLPAVWTLLDPQRIPTHIGVDLIFQPAKIRIHGGLYGLECLFLEADDFSDADLAIYREIWPRAWAWVEFFLSFFEYLPPTMHLNGMMENWLLYYFIRFSARVFRAHASQIIAFSTPGFLTALYHTWKLSLDGPPEEHEDFLMDFGVIVPKNDQVQGRDIPYVQEIIAGAGGSIDALADLLHKQLLSSKADYEARIYARNVTPDMIDTQNVLYLARIRDVVNTICVCELGDIQAPPKEFFAPHATFLLTAALFRRGSIELLLRVFVDFADADPPPGREQDNYLNAMIPDIVDVLNFAVLNSLDAFRVFIRKGYLRGMLAHSRRRFWHPKFKSQMLMLLDGTLPQQSFIHSSFILYPDAVKACEDIAATPAFRRSEYFVAWQRFMDFFKIQTRALRDLEVEGMHWRAACDNTSCATIRYKEQLRTCAGCKVRLYCSRNCQRCDWISGGHRETCTLARRVRIFQTDGLTKKDIRFLRYVMIKYGPEISPGAAYFAASYRAQRPPSLPVTKLTFTTSGDGGLYNQVMREPLFRSRASPRALDPLWDDSLDDWVARVRRSNGKMALHALDLSTGAHGHGFIYVFPLRANMSFMEDATARILKRLPKTASAEKEQEMFEKEFARIEKPSKYEVTH